MLYRYRGMLALAVFSCQPMEMQRKSLPCLGIRRKLSVEPLGLTKIKKQSKGVQAVFLGDTPPQKFRVQPKKSVVREDGDDTKKICFHVEHQNMTLENAIAEQEILARMLLYMPDYQTDDIFVPRAHRERSCCDYIMNCTGIFFLLSYCIAFLNLVLNGE